MLYEVQTLTPNIILLNHGRLLAEGHVRQIRDLIDKHPHHIVLVCDECRKLAGRVLAWDDVEGVRVRHDEKSIMVETRAPDAFYSRLPSLALEDGSGDQRGLLERRFIGKRLQIPGDQMNSSRLADPHNAESRSTREREAGQFALSRLTSLWALYMLTLRQHLHGKRWMVMAGLFLLSAGLVDPDSHDSA